MRVPRARRIGLALTVVLLVVALLALLRVPLLRATGGFLTVADPASAADVILMLPGDLDARPQRAAELYGRGLAPRVVIPRPEDRGAQMLAGVPNEAELARRILIRLGVPDTAIVVIEGEGGSTSTRDDARIFAGWASGNDVRSALVVTSAHHTRRARWALRRALDEGSVRFIMTPVNHKRFDASNWWRSEDGMLAYVTEYLKFTHNILID